CDFQFRESRFQRPTRVRKGLEQDLLRAEKGLAGMRFRLFETRARRVSFLEVMGGLLVASAWSVAVPAALGDSPASGTADTPVATAAPSLSPAEARLRADVSFLAADAREGRAPGTKGIEASAAYIAEAFKELGLKPAPGADGYFQNFNLTGRPKLG